MRGVILAMAIGTTSAIAGSAPAFAVGTAYPFCIQGQMYPGLSNCTFTSYEQCQASATGRNLQCIANPFYAGTVAPRGYRPQPQEFPPEANFFGLFLNR
jgi:hypothetical protein